ncbi:ATP-binding protein [Streptomyces sp. NPDC059076]|uniref:ATP-binding protein n=1 Tax=unclassified Streptomyces TaxID=2593676 RepID=UPI0036B65DAB
MSDTCGGAFTLSRWRPTPRSVGQARAEFRDVLNGWGLAPIEQAALIVLSELLTNAVRHARVPGRDIETRYLPLWRGVRIEVHDASDARPRLTVPAVDATGGRGLPLVAALSDAWGVASRTGPGKIVWAELTLPELSSG